MHQKGAGLVPCQDTCLGCCSVPHQGMYGGNRWTFLSHINVPPPSSLSKISTKTYPRVRIEKEYIS